jgi:hypothetical protein
VQTLRKLSQFSAREFWVLAQAAVLLSAVRFALNFVTSARLQLIGVRTVGDSRRGSLGPTTGLSPQTTARLVRIAAERGPYRAKCLEQSLVLRRLLLRQGIEARIVFGARKEEEQMQAHAWVEVNGVALNEDNGVYQDFSPLDELVTGN